MSAWCSEEGRKVEGPRSWGKSSRWHIFFNLKKPTKWEVLQTQLSTIVAWCGEVFPNRSRSMIVENGVRRESEIEIWMVLMNSLPLKTWWKTPELGLFHKYFGSCHFSVLTTFFGRHFEYSNHLKYSSKLIISFLNRFVNYIFMFLLWIKVLALMIIEQIWSYVSIR